MRVLILSYHSLLSNEKKGGFHDIYEALLQQSSVSAIDWLTLDVNLFRMVAGRTESLGFFDIVRMWSGHLFADAQKPTRTFSSISLMLPGRFQRLVSWAATPFLPVLFDSSLLHEKYDLVIVESLESLGSKSVQHLIASCRRKIYRPSDPLVTWSHSAVAKSYENFLVKSSDQVWYVNESCASLFKRTLKAYVIHNCAEVGARASITQVERSSSSRQKTCTYIGAFPVDHTVIKYAASQLPEVQFLIYGPFPKLRQENIKYAGMLDSSNFVEAVVLSDVFIVPYKKKGRINDVLEITKKMLLVMSLGKPIVAYNCSPVVERYGIRLCPDRRSFVAAITSALKSSTVSYDTDLLSEFSKEHFLKIVSERIREVIDEKSG